MRIGIDARLYTQTGVGRYLRNLISKLSDLDRENEYVIYLRNKEYEEFILPSYKWKKKKVDIPWHTLKEQFLFPLTLLSDKLDVVHFPYFNVPVFYPGKYLLTIHDLIIDHFDTGRSSTLPYPLYFLKRLGYKVSLSLGIKRAKAITAISECTKNEIIEHYHVNPLNINVTYDALDLNFKEILKTHRAKNYYSFPYILYVGNAYPHKNLERLLQAFKQIRQKFNLKLVLAGADGYFYPRLNDFAEKLGLGNEVIFFGYANDTQLINLYSSCRCLVFPSLMEGFGLPNLEALACGRLPVISDIPVFREIWRKDLLYFDPENVSDMADKLMTVLSLTDREYHHKVEIAQKRLKDYSWRKTAGETLKLYQKIMS